MDIVLVILASVVPVVLMYLFIRKQDDRPGYKDDCKSAVGRGFLSTGPVILVGLVMNIVTALLGRQNWPLFWQSFYRCFFLYALNEEMVKTFMFTKTVKKAKADYSWLNIIAYMTLVGAGFEILESIAYGFSTSPGQGLVRGVTMMHTVFGFIGGCFYGKAIKTGNKMYNVIGFVIPLLYHGTYDFFLEEMFRDTDVFLYDLIPVTLAFISLIFVFVIIIFFIKSKKKETYTVSIRKS